MLEDTCLRPISNSFFGKLRKAGLVEGNRGPKGGYRLAKSSDQIRVDEILDAVDSTLKTSECTKSRAGCDGQGRMYHLLIYGTALNEEMRKFLHDISLKDLCGKEAA